MQEKIKKLLEKDNARIKWVNYGSANSFCYNWKRKKYKVIEINKALIDYPKLFMPIFVHEISHSKELYNYKDLATDMKVTIPKFEFLKFMFANPTTFIELLPAYNTKKHGWVIDINMIGLWIFGSVITIIGYIILRK